MERLTKRDSGGNAVVDCDVCELGESRLANCGVLKCRNRLKDRLAYYEDAEEQGRLIVLPDNFDEIYNKRGDNIYALIDGDLHELLMTDTFIGKEHTLMIDCFEVDDVWVEEGGEPVEKEMPTAYGFPIYYVGKSVFLSREEAEKALEGMR